MEWNWWNIIGEILFSDKKGETISGFAAFQVSLDRISSPAGNISDTPMINLILRVIFHQIEFDYLKCQIVYYLLTVVLAGLDERAIHVFVKKNIRVNTVKKRSVCEYGLNPKFRSNY